MTAYARSTAGAADLLSTPLGSATLHSRQRYEVGTAGAASHQMHRPLSSRSLACRMGDAGVEHSVAVAHRSCTGEAISPLARRSEIGNLRYSLPKTW